MNFQRFWKALTAELARPRKFKTMTRKKPFEVIHVSHNTITIKNSEGNERSIGIEDFQSIWNNIKRRTIRNRYVNVAKNLPSQNSSYVRTLIHHIVREKSME